MVELENIGLISRHSESFGQCFVAHGDGVVVVVALVVGFGVVVVGG